jgi:crossover junction endodeoxyribonuclease RusA
MFAFAWRGDPVSKERPRTGKGGRVYTPEKTRAAEDELRLRLRAAGARPAAGELRVTLAFRCRTRHRRDIDNLAKLVLDSCNEIVWGDDAQVSELHVFLERGHPAPGFDMIVEAA